MLAAQIIFHFRSSFPLVRGSFPLPIRFGFGLERPRNSNASRVSMENPGCGEWSTFESRCLSCSSVTGFGTADALLSRSSRSFTSVRSFSSCSALVAWAVEQGRTVIPRVIADDMALLPTARLNASSRCDSISDRASDWFPAEPSAPPATTSMLTGSSLLISVVAAALELAPPELPVAAASVAVP